MGRVMVQLEGVGKRYLLGEDHGGYRTLRESISGAGRRLTGRGSARTTPEELWSLRDVSFEMAQGEALGIIGRNGAGKSTLLKVLTRITEPTEGVCRTRGRVGALLEVGTGFHPELTGSENVYLNGAILGMGRRDIARRYDEIIDFAGIERFLDTPIKRYSSGMYLRLAFAVAAHLEPDILVVDEILAVGDAEFQRKCLGRMEAAEREGRTVIFVSHSLDTILQLCPRTIWLDRGRVLREGPTSEVVDAYLAASIERAEAHTFGQDQQAPVWVTDLRSCGPSGEPASTLRRDELLELELEIEVRSPVAGFNFALSVDNLRGVRVLDEAWSDDTPNRTGEPGRYRARVRVPSVLPAGEYAVNVWVGSAYETLVWEQEAMVFRLEGDLDTRPNRLVQLDLPWDVRHEPGEGPLPDRA